MRFAFAGCDRNLALFEAVQHAGWQPVKIFTVSPDEKSTHSNGLLTLARHTSIPLQYTPIQRQDFIDLNAFTKRNVCMSLQDIVLKHIS